MIRVGGVGRGGTDRPASAGERQDKRKIQIWLDRIMDDAYEDEDEDDD